MSVSQGYRSSHIEEQTLLGSGQKVHLTEGLRA